jgi:hypothetical protein
MKVQIKTLFVFFSKLFAILSCKRELSCENCNGNNSVANKPPVACAGADQTIALPTNAVTLDGSCSADPDNNIVGYEWSKIAGPTSFAITNANVVKTQVDNLAEGTYQFELKVTDAGGLFSNDTVKVTINPAPPLTMVCDSNRPQINVRLVQVGTLSLARAGMVAAAAGNKILFAGVNIEMKVQEWTFLILLIINGQLQN